MKYTEWEKRFPKYVIIQKEYDSYREQYFYNSKGISANVLNNLLDYNFYIERLTGRVAAGGPNLEKITDALNVHHISYVVVDKDKIIAKHTYEESNAFQNLPNPEDSKEFVEALKISTKPVHYTEDRNTLCRQSHFVKGQDIGELINRRICHKSDGYGEGTIKNAYYVFDSEGKDIRVDIAFDNGRVANSFSLKKCFEDHLLEIE